jgi:hypothetical protein
MRPFRALFKTVIADLERGRDNASANAFACECALTLGSFPALTAAFFASEPTEGATSGAFAIGVLRAGPRAHSANLDLYADCYLALDAWIQRNAAQATKDPQ